MAKTTLIILTIAAFLYAAWLVILRKRLPDPQTAKGWRKRFSCAVILCAGFLTVSSGCRPMCYYVVPPEEQEARNMRRANLQTLRTIWLTLDEKEGEAFRQALDRVAGEEGIRPDVAAVLALTFRELSFHKARAHSRKSCYELSQRGARMMNLRGEVMQQLQMLRKAEEKDLLDKDTVQKSRTALARKLELLQRLHPDADPNEKIDWTARLKELDELSRQYENNEAQPGEAAERAAHWLQMLETMSPIVQGLRPPRRTCYW